MFKLGCIFLGRWTVLNCHEAIPLRNRQIWNDQTRKISHLLISLLINDSNNLFPVNKKSIQVEQEEGKKK